AHTIKTWLITGKGRHSEISSTIDLVDGYLNDKLCRLCCVIRVGYVLDVIPAFTVWIVLLRHSSASTSG
ncbi:hypothetical protein CHS0354_005496, partial [Potamilus streckersoni]